MKTVHTYENDTLTARQTPVVREYPLVLHVNGRELATLIASPHDLRFLVAGFLRLQGFVESVDDFHLLSVCEDFGVANVRIRNEIPERLRPILTSGCGTGVTYTLAGAHGAAEGDSDGSHSSASLRTTPDAVMRLMEELARRAQAYRSHGGIHSAAVGDADGNLILFAEDIGRHNTLDRIAGEALLRGLELSGTMLVTSGRVSAELAAKAARLGIFLVASRTSATDMAIRMCSEAGITLVGYVRGSRFTVYTHPERLGVETTRG